MAAGWPSCRYGPGGEARIFDASEDVPAGWVDHPCKLKGGDHAAALKVVPGMRELEGAELEAARAEIAKFDHDGDGHVGGSLPKADAFDKLVDGAVEFVRRAGRKVKRNGNRK